jgi:hypothetical protein
MGQAAPGLARRIFTLHLGRSSHVFGLFRAALKTAGHNALRGCGSFELGGLESLYPDREG